MLKGTNKKLTIEEKVHHDLFLKINSIETTMKSLMNRNIVSYSNRSKTTEILSNDVLHLSINSVTKSFVFTYANNSISISMLENAISNLKYINDISVDDLITAKNIMNNQYLIDSFSSINNVLDLYKKHILIDEDNDTITIVNDIIVNKIDVKSLFINGVDYYKEFTDLNNYEDNFVEETDVKFTSIDNEITTINNNYDSFKTEFNNHTHTDLTLNTLNGMPIIGNNSEFITTYPFIPTVGWYPFNIMQNLDFHNKTKSGYIWRLCANNNTTFQILNNGKTRLTIDKNGVYINKNLKCDTINGINTSNISLNTHTHSYNDLTNIPETFTPSEHTHSFTSLTDIPDTFPPAEHNHDTLYSKLDHVHSYNDLTDIPTSFNPSEHNHDTLYSAINHTHSYNDLTDIPELALANHTHSYNDLTNIPESFKPSEHNHDSLYSKLDHTHSYNSLTDIPTSFNPSEHNHDTLYSKLNHTHGNMYSPYKHTHIKFDNDLRINGKLNDFTIPEAIEDPGEFNPPMLVGVRNNGSTRIGNELIFYRYIIDTDIYKKGFKLFVDENHNLIFNNITETTESKLFEFSMVDSSHPLYTVRAGQENSTGFSIKNSSTNNWWRFAAAYNAKDNEEYLRLYWNSIYLCYFKNCDDDINLLNTTITHNAPLEESVNNYEIGTPVFMSGMVYNLKDNIYINETTSTDCIPSVKSSGTYKEFIGICVNKHKSGDKVTIGDVMKKDIIINQDTIDFATHGDYYFKVNDSSKYSIGDTILFDGTIVNDDLPITNKITKSIVGTITGKINQNYVSVFKSC